MGHIFHLTFWVSDPIWGNRDNCASDTSYLLTWGKDTRVIINVSLMSPIDTRVTIVFCLISSIYTRVTIVIGLIMPTIDTRSLYIRVRKEKDGAFYCCII